MSANRFNAFYLAALFALSLPQTGLAESSADQGTDGLQLIEESRHRTLYAAPDVNWSLYSQIQLQEATVEFRRNWQRDQNRSWPFKVKDEDVEEIKQELATLLAEVFSEELTVKGGYALSSSNAAEVLILRPAITELDVAAPDTQNWAGINRSYTESSGRMTLQLELVDSVSGKVLSRFKDRAESPRMYQLQWTTGVSNKADARRMLQRWAVELRERLDTARSEPAGLAGPDQAESLLAQHR